MIKLQSLFIPATGNAFQMALAIRMLATALLLSASLGLAGCASTTEGGAVGAERKQFLLISSQELEQLAGKSYARLQADASKKGILNTDATLTRRVRAIASRIEPHTAVFRRDAPGWKRSRPHPGDRIAAAGRDTALRRGTRAQLTAIAGPNRVGVIPVSTIARK